jgi:outer membrane protein assembly factor BamB
MIPNRSVLDWPTGVTVFKPEKCYNGYTVVTPYRSNLIFLIDMVGRVVHAWQADPERYAESWFLRRLPNGNWLTLNYYMPHFEDASSPDRAPDSFSAIDFGQAVVELDWNGNVVWRYQAPRGWLIHHDMARLQNGNTLILVEKQTRVPEISDKPIAENFFIEVNPQGEIVWEWYTTEHFDEFGYSEEAIRLMRRQGRDIFHTNTLSVLPGNELEKTDPRFAKGNILSCQRNTNLIYIVDRKSGKVVWTWGSGRDQLVGPHHPVMLHNGNILIYDNGGQGGYPPRVRFYTRLLEINPVSGRIVWEYAHEPYSFKPTSKFFSSSWGSVQRLPNGNTFSLDCHKGRLFEVSPWGEIVWEYISPFAWGRGTQVVDRGIYRAYRYGYDEVLDPDPIFRNTDGHKDVRPAAISLPKDLGLPSTDLP